MKIVTDRLILISATAEHIKAEIESLDNFSVLINAAVPEGWPPGEYDRNAQDFFIKLLSECNPGSEGWYNWYAILNPVNGKDPVVIGAGGYTGPPDENGDVEIGYSFIPAYRGKGYATEFMETLVLRAFSFTNVKRIIAHTTPENIASSKVLEKLGFLFAGEGSQFGTIRYHLNRD